MLQQISLNFADDILKSFPLTFSFYIDINNQPYKYWMISFFLYMKCTPVYFFMDPTLYLIL